ncbi:MAG: phosphoribosylglycinamide formyltransferase [Bacteroidota bacterium]
MNTHRIAIFASGSGTNAENIVRYFREKSAPVEFMILSNNAKAGVLRRAENLGIPTLVFGRKDFYKSDAIINHLKTHGVDFVVLAGFLWRVPSSLIAPFSGRIINIHPALLPKFGGKGMHGQHVHEAVIAAKDSISGITIHHVTEEYDQGATIFQAECPVYPEDTPNTLARRIHALEYEHFPKIIEEFLG